MNFTCRTQATSPNFLLIAISDRLLIVVRRDDNFCFKISMGSNLFSTHHNNNNYFFFFFFKKKKKKRKEKKKKQKEKVEVYMYIYNCFNFFLGRGDTGPAELIQVCWLEVTGSLQLEANKTYEVGFKVSLTPDAFGWNGCPVYVMAKFGKRGKYSWKRATLKTDKVEEPYQKIPEQVLSIKSETENTLYFGLYEVWSGKWKGGLKIHEAFVNKISP
jgi:hypothetical protein